tara:strand:- start:26370 stop:27134 length:765 start_codon:yes stop_codon:yes gene_type:complete
MNKTFLKELKKMENKCSFNFYITSGYRCKNFNNSLPGSDKKSTHLDGLAADIKWDGSQKKLNEIIQLAKESNYFNRIYFHREPSNRHIHIGKNTNVNNFAARDLTKRSYYKYSNNNANNIYAGLIYNQKNNQYIRLGYHVTLDNGNSGFNIFTDKLIRKSNENIKNQFAIGFNFNSFIILGFDYYGLGLSLGSLSNNTNKSYYIEPALSMGFIFDYCDVWLNIGNIIPNKSSFNEIKGTNISLNINIGYFNSNN